ncbi:ORF60 [Retroperitoneal fibromatosis-associated herpesvirus]|uniref:ribonucleoside-diphosphate reductase n=1 Tax=Retroperitoneal fibromatosis-associated herpesvirus TaxID=111469 RepID=U5NIZ0_9GAMA|nr:ORF60 [Retroperitoneal fibromatosis-associated herpesvirus]AGY30746.1 ORF60 [Retroperitoneal fibromatosis-associated herpesvirus]
MDSINQFLYTSDHDGFLALTHETWQNRWFPGQIPLHLDVGHVQTLSEADREFYKFLFTFLGMAESLVNFNIEDLVTNFQCHDAAHYYAEQMAMENIHGKVYANILQMFFHNNRGELLTYAAGIVKDPALCEKLEWLHKRVRGASTRAQKILLFLLIEGIYFISSFYSIGLCRVRGIMPGVCLANDYISRDELLHTRAAAMLYNTLLDAEEKPPQVDVQALFREAVDIETRFIEAKAEHVTLVDVADIRRFLEATADRILGSIFLAPIFGTQPPETCPLSYTGSAKCVNFFERDNSDYTTCVRNDL